MFNARPIDVIQNDIIDTLLEYGSQLTDESEGSVLYSLVRSMAAVHNFQELELKAFEPSIYFSTARKLELDRKIEDFGITRKPGENSKGFVQAIAGQTNQQIINGTILTDSKTGLQFQVLLEEPIIVSGFAEVSLRIECTTEGELGNLKAGNRLISPVYPNVTFLVGSHRTLSGELCGDLTNGRYPETDEQLFDRFSEFVINLKQTNDRSLINLVLSNESIVWANIVVPQPGYIQVWIDSPSALSANDLTELEAICEHARPPGTLLSVHQAERVFVEVNLYVKPIAEIDFNSLTETLTGVVQTHFLSLKLGATLIRSDLIEKVLLDSNVLEAAVLTPTSDVAVQAKQILRPNAILVTYITTDADQ